MTHWSTLRKTYIVIHLEYGHARAKLFAENIRVRPGETFDVSVDLNKNLRSRSKGVGTYVDAQDLARGEILKLKTLTIDDNGVLDRLKGELERAEQEPKKWRLHVDLQGSHWFVVRPAYRRQHAYEALTFKVESVTEGIGE